MRRFQFSLKSLLWLLMVIPPSFVFGVASGRKAEEAALETHRTLVLRKEMELEKREAALTVQSRKLHEYYGAEAIAKFKRLHPGVEVCGVEVCGW